jgi:hypothetical protein
MKKINYWSSMSIPVLIMVMPSHFLTEERIIMLKSNESHLGINERFSFKTLKMKEKAKIRLLRHTTLIIEVNRKIFLIDPMLSPKNALHMDTVNHCLITRADLVKALSDMGVSSKILIPEDGETINV